MTPLEIEQLAREIGDEVMQRLGHAPKAEAAAACACETPARAPQANGRSAARTAVSFPPGVAGLINQTLLRADATGQQIQQFCREARQHRFGSICVQPPRVALAVRELRGSKVQVCAVIGYPHGATLTPVKRTEAEQVLKLGAHALELAIDPGALASGDLDAVYTEIRALAECAHAAGAALKVLAEMAALGEEQKVTVCALAKLGGADAVKTSADLPGSAVTIDDVSLAYRIVGGELGIEAAGGVDCYARFRDMMAAGASRVGTAAGAVIVREAIG
jgi:deoxyribose-phosphate aldolase